MHSITCKSRVFLTLSSPSTSNLLQEVMAYRSSLDSMLSATAASRSVHSSSSVSAIQSASSFALSRRAASTDSKAARSALCVFLLALFVCHNLAGLSSSFSSASCSENRGPNSIFTTNLCFDVTVSWTWNAPTPSTSESSLESLSSSEPLDLPSSPPPLLGVATPTLLSSSFPRAVSWPDASESSSRVCAFVLAAAVRCCCATAGHRLFGRSCSSPSSSSSWKNGAIVLPMAANTTNANECTELGGRGCRSLLYWPVVELLARSFTRPWPGHNKRGSQIASKPAAWAG
mmetsp:Transcript_54270/g.108086  ORF Transcript_54270/g.108086 Transcript_54270/m.108086 type:complete len:288 (+) Transcript_54270:763-1626(+)